MKKVVFLFLAINFSFSVSFAQNEYYISKDDRIKKYEKDIIHLLINDHQVPIAKSFRLDYYRGRIFIQKCLDIFPSSTQNGLLIVRFGSLGDHSNRYFGILSKDDKFLMPYQLDDTKLMSFLKHYDLKTRTVIIDYIKITLKEEIKD